ncbi:MAG: adenosylcobalamin-dependent ribonucleoside-diphosphate reductase [archaeon]
MVQMITGVKKRDGRVVEFDTAKITNAIFKASAAVNGRDRKKAEELADKVMSKVNESFSDSVPSVEDIQDIVETVLIEEGMTKVAKAYMLYRQRRTELREEKMIVLEKQDTDEVDKRFDLNALKVLKARYLRKDEKGRLKETPKQLFTRVAVHDALPDIFYDERVWDKEGRQEKRLEEAFDFVGNDGKYAIGRYPLNRYHLDALKRMYDRTNEKGEMKIGWNDLLGMLEKGEFSKVEKTIEEFYRIMVERKFLPNTPAIANFGNPLGMGSACFVMDIEDSIDQIMETLKQTSIVFKAGGGMGYNFSKLRPEGDFVSSTGGVASGPISFMRLFDTMTEVIKQGGIRRGANMGILNSNHPDIMKFITAKEGNKALRNFNISVLIMPDFWEHYNAGTPYPLINPRTKETAGHVDPKQLFDKIVYQAWESAEPGIIFYDHVNKNNPFLKHLGPIVTTNPCGEVLLYPNEPCNLGSVNVWAFAKEKSDNEMEVDWDGLAQAVRTASRFLDNVIDVNKFPLKEIETMALSTRKIGLGVMGVADLLYELKIPYNAPEGLEFMDKLMEFINYHSKVASIELAKERKSLPFYEKSFYPEGRLPIPALEQESKWGFDWKDISRQVKEVGIRNGFTTVIAPTGSISMIAGCSSGIEPVFSLVFEKNVKVGSFFYVDPVFEHYMKMEGKHNNQLMEDISEHRGSIQEIEYLDEDVRKTFVTAMDILPEDHIKALAVFQKWTDSSISKTNNFPADASVEYMKKSYLLAYELGCKDVTVYRDASIKNQVLVAGSSKKQEEKEANNEATMTATQHVAVSGSGTMVLEAQESMAIADSIDIPSVKSKDLVECPECGTRLTFKEGCVLCPECGWSLCK